MIQVVGSDQMPFQIIFATEMSGTDGAGKGGLWHHMDGSEVSSGRADGGKERAALQTLDFTAADISSFTRRKICQVGINLTDTTCNNLATLEM